MAPLSGDWVGEVCVDEGTVLIGAPGRVAQERADWLAEPVPAPLPPAAALPAELIRLREAVEGDEIMALMIDDAIIGFRVTTPQTLSRTRGWRCLRSITPTRRPGGRRDLEAVRSARGERRLLRCAFGGVRRIRR